MSFIFLINKNNGLTLFTYFIPYSYYNRNLKIINSYVLDIIVSLRVHIKHLWKFYSQTGGLQWCHRFLPCSSWPPRSFWSFQLGSSRAGNRNGTLLSACLLQSAVMWVALVLIYYSLLKTLHFNSLLLTIKEN